MARPFQPGLPQATFGPSRGVEVQPRRLLNELLNRIDVNRDGRITADDIGRSRVKSVNIALGPGLELQVSGAERLSGLAALLGREIRRGNAHRAVIPLAMLAPNRLDRALGRVAETWQSLLRRADSIDALRQAIDEGLFRSRDGRYHVFVPEADTEALNLLNRQAHGKRGVEVVPFPRKRGAVWHERLATSAGMAYLPRPYLVPGGMFAEMYGWDSYFQARGALAGGLVEVALDIAENLAYQIRYFGKIANSNRSYHLSRTQPPLLSALARSVFVELERRQDPRAEPMLARCARAVEHSTERIWRRAPRITPLGLSRYHDEARGPCPEVPAAFYAAHPRTASFWDHDRAQRESGWDLTHRWGTEAHLHVPVCLNALLYRQERDLAAMFRRLDGAKSSRAAKWDRRARERRDLVDRYLWDPQRGMYFDHSLRTQRRSRYESLATFYPLWVGMASGHQAARVAENLGRFLEPGGLATTSRKSRATARREPLQWDWPIGWAPLQVIAVEGLRRYGYHGLADQVAYRWLHMVLRVSGESNGTVREKYNVAEANADVEALEYANQGDDLGAYLHADDRHGLGFGWTNASIPLLLAELGGPYRVALEHDLPPSEK